MADATITQSEPTPAPTKAEVIGQTTLEHDGRVFTGTGTDADATDAAFAETTVGQKADAEAAKENRPTRGQRRFDHLTKEREAAKREADAAKAEAAAIKAELEALKAKPAETKPAETESKTAAKAETPAANRPKLEDFLNETDPLAAFDSALNAYHEAQIDTKLDAKLSARIEAEQASRTLHQTVADLRERGRAAYSDFDAVLSTGGTKPMDEAILWHIVNDPNAEHIQYAIASDDAVYKEFAGVRDPIVLGRLLARYGSVTKSAAPASPAVTTSKAPRPFQPVSGASRTASLSHEDLAAAGDFERYKAKRHADMGVKIR